MKNEMHWDLKVHKILYFVNFVKQIIIFFRFCFIFLPYTACQKNQKITVAMNPEHENPASGSGDAVRKGKNRHLADSGVICQVYII